MSKKEVLHYLKVLKENNFFWQKECRDAIEYAIKYIQ